MKSKFYYSDGTTSSKRDYSKVLHREDGPACEYISGTKSWYINGKLHREDAPAIEYSDGTKSWIINSKYHREDGPAIEHSSGTKEWYKENRIHRENDLPAFECTYGYKAWYKEGQRHRLIGPAIIYANCLDVEYWIEGKNYSKQQFDNIISNMQIKFRIKSELMQSLFFTSKKYALEFYKIYKAKNNKIEQIECSDKNNNVIYLENI